MRISIDVYEHKKIMLDSSAIIAKELPSESRHQLAQNFLEATREEPNEFYILNETSHETFTRARRLAGLSEALRIYSQLRGDGVKIKQLTFLEKDEQKALELLKKYNDKHLSFHDALCAAVMMRNNIYRIFSFDHDFRWFGFLVHP